MKRKPLLLISIGLVVTLLTVLIGGEMYARHVVKDCMTSQFDKELGSQIDVGLGFKPVLLEMIDKSIPKITLESTDSAFGHAQGMEVHAEVHDIKLEDGSRRAGTIGSSEADVEWNTHGIAETLKKQPFGNTITSVKANKTDNTLVFDVGQLASVTVAPRIAAGQVVVETKDASVLGFGLPTGLVDGIVKSIADGLQQYPIGMTARDVKVTDDGIDLTLRGGAFDLPNDEFGSCTKS